MSLRTWDCMRAASSSICSAPSGHLRGAASFPAGFVHMDSKYELEQDCEEERDQAGGSVPQAVNTEVRSVKSAREIPFREAGSFPEEFVERPVEGFADIHAKPDGGVVITFLYRVYGLARNADKICQLLL